MIRQQRIFLRIKQAKRLMRRMIIAPVTEPALIRRWIGLLMVMFALFLAVPSSLHQVPPPLVQSRDLMPDTSETEITPPQASIFEPFPFPEALQPQVSFWRDIFTRYSTNQIVIHDNWYLPVIYEVVDLKSPEFKSEKEGWKAVEAAQKKYATLLKRLAKTWDSPEEMTATERQVYDLFSDFPDSTRFKKKDAADRVRAQRGQADRVKTGLIQAGAYLGAMKKILAEHDVPETLVYLPVIESAFNTQAKSYLGAAGPWQFMRSTGKHYHLTINAHVDERKDPLRATRAAAELLSYNYQKITSWPLAITAYNHGLSGMKNAVKKVGTDDIDVIIEQYDGSRFGFASRNFYPEFLAAIDVGLRYTEYFGEIELYTPLTLTQIKLPDHVKVKTLEKYTSLTADDIKALNPALHSSVFKSGSYIPKNYVLNIPLDQKKAFETAYAAIPQSLKYQYVAVSTKHRVKKGETLSAIAIKYKTSIKAIMRLNNIKNSSKIRAGQLLKIPGGYVATAANTPASSPSSSASSSGTHRVQKGQTLIAIARQHKTTVQAIANLNNIKDPGSLRIGQELTIPGSTSSSQSATSSLQVASSSQESAVHRVKKGQTLTAIAKQYNTTVGAIASLNKITNPRRIKPGQLLKIPRG
jgi:membrane-bound lytic murein transglycosylase D